MFDGWDVHYCFLGIAGFILIDFLAHAYSFDEWLYRASYVTGEFPELYSL